MLLKDFRLLVVGHLVGFANRPKKRRPAYVSPLKKSKRTVSDTIRTAQTFHLSSYSDTRMRCAYCSSKTNDKRTRFLCLTCNVSLCIEANENCFEKFHKAS